MIEKKIFIAGGVVFEATPEKKCKYEIGQKGFTNKPALRMQKITPEREFADEASEELFERLNNLHLLRRLFYNRLSESFKDYASFIGAGQNRGKIFTFESQSNGVIFMWAEIHPVTRELTYNGYALRGIKETNFCKYYRGGVDKTAWFFHKKLRKNLWKIRRCSYRVTPELYEDLERMSIEEIEALLISVEDEKLYDKIKKYLDSL